MFKRTIYYRQTYFFDFIYWLNKIKTHERNISFFCFSSGYLFGVPYFNLHFSHIFSLTFFNELYIGYVVNIKYHQLDTDWNRYLALRTESDQFFSQKHYKMAHFSPKREGFYRL